MWLENDVLKVFFDEKRGGMPTGDSFGFLRAASIEIAYTSVIPFFQSLNDKHPQLEKRGNMVIARGIMSKGKTVVPHTYKMTATLEGNELRLAFELSVTKTERIVRSKIWLWTNEPLDTCMLSGEILDEDLDPEKPNWNLLYQGEQPEKPIVFLGTKGRLEILGETTPSIYASVISLRKYPKLETAFGWATESFQKRIYSGSFLLTYRKGQ